MEKETIYSDAEMVGLPQSGGGRRQRMAAGGDTDLSHEDRRKTAASSAVLRPDESLTALENNRPDAFASSQGLKGPRGKQQATYCRMIERQQ